jgi:hypothetical protein
MLGGPISMSNKIGSFKGYPVQVVEIRPGDTILVHISDDLSLDECSEIHKMMCETYPDNTILLSNEHVLKGMTILRNSQPIDDVVSINTNVDVNKLFEDIMRGNPNDFLY